MPPLAIVEQFDVFEDFASGLGSGVPVALITQFDFEGGKKTLGHRVIPAIAFTAHAAQKTMCRQQLLILGAGGVCCRGPNGAASPATRGDLRQARCGDTPLLVALPRVSVQVSK